MQRRDDQERRSETNSKVKDAKLAKMMNFAKVEIDASANSEVKNAKFAEVEVEIRAVILIAW